MRKVRFTTLAISLPVSLTVVPAPQASAGDGERNRCTRLKVAAHPLMWNRPEAWSRSVRVPGPTSRLRAVVRPRRPD